MLKALLSIFFLINYKKRCAQAMYIIKKSSEAHYNICKGESLFKPLLLEFDIGKVQGNIKMLEETVKNKDTQLGKLDLEMEVKKLEERKMELEKRLTKLRAEEINYKKWISNITEQRKIKYEKEKYEKELLLKQIKEKEESKKIAKELALKEIEEEKKKKEEENIKKELIKKQLLEKYNAIIKGDSKKLDLEVDAQKIQKEFSEKMELSKKVFESPKKKAEDTQTENKSEKYEIFEYCYNIINNMVENLDTSILKVPKILVNPIIPEEKKSEKKRNYQEKMEISDISAENSKFIPPTEITRKSEKIGKSETNLEAQKWEIPKSQYEVIQEKMENIFKESGVALFTDKNIISKNKLLMPIDLACYLSIWQEITKQGQIANSCLMHVFLKEFNLINHLQILRRYF